MFWRSHVNRALVTALLFLWGTAVAEPQESVEADAVELDPEEEREQ